jgi:VIT1/CCC1 family predicted Fe2+/Mn2+ transporter
MANFKTGRIFLLFVSVLGVCFSVLFLVPIIQSLIIDYVQQQIIHRELKNINEWISAISVFGKGCLFIIFSVNLLIFTKLGEKTSNDIKKIFKTTDYKRFVTPALFLFLIYFIAYFSLIRSDFSYNDDLRRAATGYHRWKGWSRYVPQFLSTVLHADPVLSDISPFTQILALAITTVNSLLLICIFEVKISIKSLIASLPVGLTPYFLENLSYKFDSPYMALSVLFPLLPFVFIKQYKTYIVTSIVCLLLMCATYQASSGIYIIVVLFMAFKFLLYEEKEIRDILIFLVISISCYCFSLISFKLFFLIASDSYGVSTSIMPMSSFFSGIFKNILTFYSAINQDFGIIWKVLTLALCIFFSYSVVKAAGQKKILFFVLSCLILFFCSFLSYGAFLVLEHPLFSPRSLYGIGFFISIICLFLLSNTKAIAFISVLLLNWCFFVFALSYGNALADQKRYSNFRMSLLASDLGKLYPDYNVQKYYIKTKNSIGYGPLTRNISRHYPIINKLVAPFFQPEDYIIDYMRRSDFEIADDSIYDMDLPIVYDSFYHTIKSNDTFIFILFKQP